MSNVEKRLADIHRRAARALGTLSLALARKRISRRIMLDTALAFQRSAEELDELARNSKNTPSSLSDEV